MTERFPVAAIDVGTNSFHLLIASADPRRRDFKVLARRKEIVRLGEGAVDMKRLSPEAMNRALRVLRRFRAAAHAAGAPIRAVATSAVREALNQRTFLSRVRAETGIDLEVVSGVEEARLIYRAVQRALPVRDETILLFDIGGGSTEFLVGRRGEILYSNSLKLGAVRLTRRFFPDGRYTDRRLSDCRAFIRGTLSPVARSLSAFRWSRAVATAGTALTVAAITRRAEGRSGNDLNGVAIPAARLLATVDRIAAARTLRARLRIEGLDASRADIIVAGALILGEILSLLRPDRLTLSTAALREGILLDALDKRRLVRHLGDLTRLRYTSVQAWARTLRYEKPHAHHVARLALSLFDQTRRLHGLGPAARGYLEAAALLHDVGFFISHAQHHRHTYYLIRNAELFGFTEGEKEIIANVARHHRKSHPKPHHEGYARLARRERHLVRTLAGLLRVADGLDRSHTGKVKSVSCRRAGRHLRIVAQPRRTGAPLDLEVWGASRKKGLLEEALDVSVVIAPARVGAPAKR